MTVTSCRDFLHVGIFLQLNSTWMYYSHQPHCCLHSWSPFDFYNPSSSCSSMAKGPGASVLLWPCVHSCSHSIHVHLIRRYPQNSLAWTTYFPEVWQTCTYIRTYVRAYIIARICPLVIYSLTLVYTAISWEGIWSVSLIRPCKSHLILKQQFTLTVRRPSTLNELRHNVSTS